MTSHTVAGPVNKESADSTALSLGNQYSVYGKERKDTAGYGTGEYDYYVEQDDTIVPDRIFGYETKHYLARQYK